jgi:hypothetical protein
MVRRLNFLRRAGWYGVISQTQFGACLSNERWIKTQFYKAYRSQNINDSWIQKIKQDFVVFKSQGYKMLITSEFKITSGLKNEKVTIYLRLVGLVFIFYWCYFKFPNVYL